MHILGLQVEASLWFRTNWLRYSEHVSSLDEKTPLQGQRHVSFQEFLRSTVALTLV
jgi:hypothetical protein